MKLSLKPQAKRLASALLISLVICSLLSLFIMYYLSLAEQQVYLNARSQAWNMAIAVTEAGVEEGLEQLNNNLGNLTADGWTYDSSTSMYWHSNTLAPNGYIVYVSVTNIDLPVIVAKAYVQPPPVLRSFGAALFAAAGVNAGPTAPLARAVKVTASRSSLYMGALIVKSNANFNGNDVLTDSFNSQDPARSTNGKYDRAKAGDHGDVASNWGFINIGNANLYGKAHINPKGTFNWQANGAVGEHAWQATHQGIEPGWLLYDANFTFPDTTPPAAASTWTPSTSGTVVVTNYPVTTTATNSTSYTSTTSTITTNVAWQNNVSTPPPTPVPAGTTTNTTANSTSSQYPSIGVVGGAVPGTVTWNPTYNNYKFTKINSFTWPLYSYTWNLYTTNMVVSTNYYDHILYANQKYCETAGLTGKTIVMGPTAAGTPYATVYLPNGMTGNENITIAQAGAVLVYAGGTSVGIAGNNVINPNGFAGSFIVFCAPSVTSFSLSGNGAFTGVLVAPNADLALNGGGNNVQDFSGCILAKSATLNGHFNFHWDEALGTSGKNGRYLATSWNEISPY